MADLARWLRDLENVREKLKEELKVTRNYYDKEAIKYFLKEVEREIEYTMFKLRDAMQKCGKRVPEELLRAKKRASGAREPWLVLTLVLKYSGGTPS